MSVEAQNSRTLSTLTFSFTFQVIKKIPKCYILVINENKKLFQILYFQGPNIFTAAGGQTIYIPKNDSHIRIPCSVSNPKVSVILEKSVGVRLF